MKAKQCLRIVLASPGDVKEERKVMESVIDELNRGVAADRNLLLELSRWETDAYPGFHADGPQGLIDPILRIEDCDILLGIFWKRFGTPTRNAQSGTEHEIRTAIRGWRQNNRPQIMMYFKETPFFPQTTEEHEQFGLVIRFRNEFPKEGLYGTFQDVSQFERLARQHMSNFIRHEYKLTGAGAGGSLQRSETQDFMRNYCKRIQLKFSSMYFFGSQCQHAGKSGETFDHMASIDEGFVPLYLSDWQRVATGSDVEPLGIEDLFINGFKEPRFLVRGLPGGGKTTLMRYLVHRFATLGAEGKKELIPVYVRLRDFCCTKNTLDEFVKQQINEDSDSPEMLDVLCDKRRFLEQPMALFLDGLDEIEDPETNKKIAGIMDAFAKKYPRCRIIVTSRPIGLKSEDYPGYRPLDLLPLDDLVMKEYLGKWFKDDTDKIDVLWKTFGDKPRIRALAANPFLLSMICFTFGIDDKAELIERRSQLYANCTRSLLDRPYDTDQRQTGKVHITYEEALGLLKDISLKFFLWQEADFDPDHVKVIGRSHPTAALPGKTDEVLDLLQRETGLIQRLKEGYTFVHRSLWEYFTALALLEKKQEFVIRHAANPDWEEVVRLYAGLLVRDDDVKELINGLWTINRPLALRVTTEVKTSVDEIIQPLIEQEQGNQGKLLLIDSLEQSLPLVSEAERQNLVQETLRIMLLECGERDCEVIYRTQILLTNMELKPLEPGGILYELLDLEHAAERQRAFLNDPANCLEWIGVQGGTFLMGDDNHGDNERPAHQVKVDSFFMAKHPVTNRMLANFPLGKKYPNYGGDSHPAVSNTWFEAYYCALWLDARLPTEAEWEYAARGGESARRPQYYFGDNPEDLTSHAWFGEADKPHAHAVDEVNPHAGAENLNSLGLANMHGNVYEWCADWYDADYYKSSPKEEPRGPEKGSSRVMRGGSWTSVAQNCRSANRSSNAPDNRFNRVGIRLTRSVNP
ncbi:MAG: hypothetical protein B6D35_05245 [Candidatus Brocadia sp. UTAMX2]|jgi:formylglycine-generating enzyme required for sulfatase activity|nr:MAG: hypothetical protein B6D35_05245 [Candidatus Brocadia sp. UTAMX2]